MAGTPPVYNGDSNNLTGEGSPNPQKLTIPYLDQVGDPQTKAALLKIQQFINNLVAPTSSGVYASLTGPGETATPGALTQLGDFTVADGTGPDGITLETGASLPIFLSASDGIVNGNLATVTLDGSGTGDVTIQAGHGGGADIAVSATGTSPGSIDMTAQSIELGATDIGFFGATPAPKPTVTGSRSGNVALADLLTRLATLGLLIDSTTP